MSLSPQVEEFWAQHDGRRIHATTTGSGELPIVLLTGMGTPARHWRQVPAQEWQDGVMATAPWAGRPLIEPHLSLLTRVIAYDRAGMGVSQPPTAPRDLDDFLAELEAVMDAARVERAVLVGHSMGGLIAYAFARRHPERVAGLVLLDASHPDSSSRFATSLPTAEWSSLEAHATAFPQSHPERPSWLNMTRQGPTAATIGALGSLPLAVVARGRAGSLEQAQRHNPPTTPEGLAALEAAWRTLQEELARTSINGELIVAPGSTHYVHYDEPDVVLNATQRVWTTAHTQRH